MRVVIDGNGIFRKELTNLAEDAGHEVYPSAREMSVSRREADEELERQFASAEIAIGCNFRLGYGERSFRHYQYLPPDAPILALALTITVTEFARRLGPSEDLSKRVVGWGAFPLNISRDGDGIVEVARGLQTDDKYFELANKFWQSLGLETVEVAEGPGLVRARVLCSLINEAVSALADGVASAADIDAAMQLGNNYPKGLLAWADELGLEALHILLNKMYEASGQARYKPHPLLKRMLVAGHKGKRSGRGFFEY